MPAYQIKAPNGQMYRIEGPPGASDAQIRAEVLRQHPEAVRAQGPDRKAAPRSLPGQLWDSTVNTAAGVAQGAAGLLDMAATGVGKAVSIVPTASAAINDTIGNRGAADWSRQIASNLANPTTIGGVVERYAPTPDTTSGKVQRFAGQMVGGVAGTPASAMSRVVERFAGAVPKGYRAPTKASATAPTIVDEAKQAGVRVMTSDVRPPRTFVGKSAQAIGERIPFAGTGGPRQAQQGERIEAVRNLAREYGASVGDDIAAPAIDDVMTDLATRRGAELTRFTGMKESVIGRLPGAVPVGRTVNAIDEEIASMRALKSDAYSPVIAKLEDWKQAIQGQNLPNIELLRKQVGESFKAPELAAIRGVGEKALTRIYGPLREDMGAFIKTVGGEADFAKWKTANDSLASMAGELGNNTLRNALKTGNMTPENVAGMLFSGKPSDVRRLYAGLTGTGRARAQAAILQRALEKSSGVEGLSPDRFVGQVKTLGKSIGVFFQGDDLARIEGLSRVLSVTKRAAAASVSPPTGVQAVPYVMGAGLTSLFGIPGGVGAAGGLGLLARAYESAPVRNALLKLAATKPGSVAERTMLNRAATAIGTVVSSNQTRTASNVLNDNLPAIGAAAASPDQGPDQPYQ